MTGYHRILSVFLLILTCYFSVVQSTVLHTNAASKILSVSPLNLQKDELLRIKNDDGVKKEKKHTGHKGILPINGSDVAGFILEALSLMIAAGGGIGGGGILVPIYSLVLGFRPKHAIPLANVSVFGGAIANVLLNLSKRHPHADRPLIDWELILLMQPPLIAGSLIGAILNKLIPESILVVMLVLILSITAYKTLAKGKMLYEKENENLRIMELAENSVDSTVESLQSSNDLIPLEMSTDQNVQSESNVTNVEPKVSPSTPLLDEERVVGASEESSSSLVDQILKSERRTPIIIVLVIVVLFVVVIALNVLKGGGAEKSPLGIKCGTLGFWLIQGFMLVWIVSVTLIARHYLLKRTELKKEINYPFKDGDIVWDYRATTYYPLLCGVAGLGAGMFGFGGGIIVGPIMLALDVHPLVVAATSATMNLLTSFTVTTSFIMFGLLRSNYSYVLATIAFFATFVGQILMNVLLKNTGRYSYISFIIGFIVLISAILMAFQAAFPVKEMHQSRETGHICSSDV